MIVLNLQALKCLGETAKVWAECIAYGSAGAFLIYKVFSGYFVTDLSMKVSCERLASGGLDHLAVIVSIKKGEKGTVRLHDARVRISNVEGTPLQEKILLGTKRLSFNTDAADRMTVVFDRESKKAWLSLPPGDETQFASHFAVPTGSVCLVEVVMLGRKLWGGAAAQWRGSAISLPKS